MADAQRAACGGRYARRLKHLITFMHYGMRPSDVTREDFELFADVRAHLTTPSRKTRLPAEENGSTHICA